MVMKQNSQDVLTMRQEEVLVFIYSFLDMNGFPPTLREIGRHFHIAASSVFEHLKALERKKFIKRLPLKSRCLEVLKRNALPLEGNGG